MFQKLNLLPSSGNKVPVLLGPLWRVDLSHWMPVIAALRDPIE